MRKHNSHSHEMDLSRDYLQQLGYEPRDVSLPVLIKWLIILFVGMAVTAAGTWVMYQVFVAEEPNQNARSLDVNMRKIPPPPNPLLQGYPLDDIHDFRDKEAERLDGYAWRDRAKGIATIPVDKALDIVAEKGLPTKQPGKPPAELIRRIEVESPTQRITPPTGEVIPAPMAGHITDGVGVRTPPE